MSDWISRLGPDGTELGPGAISRPRPIGEAIGAVVRARGLGESAVLAQVMTAFEQAVGPEVSNHVVPVAIHGRELVCEVDSSAYATQLRLLSGEVLARLEEVIGERVADRLTARVSRHS
jgi:predicted nucleic acid-binding Zn ribbon protein